MALAALCDDLVLYFENRRALAVLNHEIHSIGALIDMHEDLLGRLRQDPNMIKRIAPAVLGAPPADANATYPLTGLRELSVARETLKNVRSESKLIPEVPNWLLRCSEPRRRTALFLSGCVLILIAFACFGLKKGPESAPKTT